MAAKRPTAKSHEKEEKQPKKAGIDWAALGYGQDDDEYQSEEDIKVNTGPAKFRVTAGKTYRIGFPFVAPGKGGAFQVRFKPVSHLKYYDEDTESGAKFVMPADDKLRKKVIDTFGSKAVNTHYLTPIIVYDTNDEGKLLSRKEVSYSIKVLAIPAGRYAKLKEASEQFSLSNYDFTVTLDGDAKTEHYQKMNFKAVTSKENLNAHTAQWQKGVLVHLSNDEDEDPVAVTMEEVIAECYEVAPTMIEVLGTRELTDKQIAAELEKWSDIDEDEGGEDYADEDEDEVPADDIDEDEVDEDEEPEDDYEEEADEELPEDE